MVILLLLTSLLFSVGEGLRLTPFPSNLEIAEKHQLNIALRDGSGVVHAGPIVGPEQVRKRSKSQSTDIEIPTSARFNFSTHFQEADICYRSLALCRFFIRSTSDRAPPA
jgi:hypothetical protein